MAYDISPMIIEDANIGFLNFRGAEGKYNEAGKRSFSVFLSDEDAAVAREQGWNVKTKLASEDRDGYNYINVAVNLEGRRPPKIVQVIPELGNKRVIYDPQEGIELINAMDTLIYKRVRLSLTPYVWNVRDQTGVKAYLKTMYFEAELDDFEQAFGDPELPDLEERPF